MGNGTNAGNGQGLILINSSCYANITITARLKNELLKNLNVEKVELQILLRLLAHEIDLTKLSCNVHKAVEGAAVVHQDTQLFSIHGSIFMVIEISRSALDSSVIGNCALDFTSINNSIFCLLYLERRPRHVFVAEFDSYVIIALFGGNVVHRARPVLVILALKGQTIVSNIFV